MSEQSDADPDLSFSTAADLREASGDGPGSESDDAFADLHHPERTFPRAGGMRYEGATVIELTPRDGPVDEAELVALTDTVLSADRYRVGDWFDLPLPVFLVHDDETGDTFRLAVREAAIELHVRSETGAEGLRAFHDRLVEVAEHDAAGASLDWRVTRRTD
ncbi:hypothetical protein [Haloglomus salinum]|jgi:hypothetical protein|uniref:hypothetical protein n=1 Tax=Haloglomus salinum TaxID=2962673 RepID=UPI0020C95E5E|nr:hypothetical protein [Haloglomus salinum]